MQIADLFDAIRSGDLAAVQQALADGVTPNATRDYQTVVDRDQYQGTESALMLALTQGDSAIVAALLAAGARPDAQALPEAARLGRVDLAELLVDAGLDPNASGALASAAMSGRADMIRWLVAHGVDVTERGPEALHCAANAGRVEATRVLLALGVPIEARTSYGWTPLHLAAYNGDVETVRALLDAGADPGADDGTGKTPLDWARARAKADNAALLEAALRSDEADRER